MLGVSAIRDQVIKINLRFAASGTWKYSNIDYEISCVLIIFCIWQSVLQD